jgi:membrane protein DedA with SNARE-associated domain
VQVIKFIGGVILLLLALLLVLTALGVLGGQAKGSKIDSSSEAFARMIGGILPALILAAGGVWLLQRRKPK